MFTSTKSWQFCASQRRDPLKPFFVHSSSETQPLTPRHHDQQTLRLRQLRNPAISRRREQSKKPARDLFKTQLLVVDYEITYQNLPTAALNLVTSTAASRRHPPGHATISDQTSVQ
jgi:hypothetical protein